jgi:hypothetical protein
LETDIKHFLEKKKIGISMEELSKKQLQREIIMTTMSHDMGSGEGAEISSMAEHILTELEKAGLDFEVSNTYINSIFNFNNVYRPLYDLLDLATNGTYDGNNMSDEYRSGVIDSILALKKYAKYHGYGDLSWEIQYNTVTNRGDQWNPNVVEHMHDHHHDEFNK